jgi:hypothetical protein
MKVKHLFLIAAFAAGAFLFYQYFPAMGATRTSMEAQSTPTSTDVQESSDQTQRAIVLSNDLTAKWLESLGSGEWLYISSKYETDQELGVDPETGWPIPKHSLWEEWYQLDDQGRQTISITKRTDLENGNVSYGVWSGNELLRLPSEERENTSEREGWESFRPIRDHYCNTRVSNVVNLPDEGVSTAVTFAEVNDGAETKVSIVVMHPTVNDVTGFSGSFVGDELNCYRDSQTGAIIRAEEFLITDKGERVLLSNDYDYVVGWVADLPVDVMDALTQFKAQ